VKGVRIDIMSKYATKWIDYSLPEGEEFSLAVCGYSGMIRNMYIGTDPVRRMLTRYVYVEDGFCSSGDHCFALDCPLNRSEKEHLLHMMDMTEDENLDPDTARQWGTESTLDGFILFARKIRESLPDDLKRRQEPIEED
jgi:hypothetical protein